jgi:hypothetical protein
VFLLGIDPPKEGVEVCEVLGVEVMEVVGEAGVSEEVDQSDGEGEGVGDGEVLEKQVFFALAFGADSFGSAEFAVVGAHAEGFDFAEGDGPI